MDAKPTYSGDLGVGSRAALADWSAIGGLPAPGATVVVAMSGGVDSSVVAALLHRLGYKVIGVTLQLYDHGQAVGKKGSCCAGQDIHDARAVAQRIGFAHYVLDYEQRFRERVIDTFADSYLKGETPLPCATCNSQIKFADLLETARDLGAEVLATGHYIRRVDVAGVPTLARAHDADRDQSYFLYGTSRAQLSQLVFPLGGMTKPDVRKLAHALGVPVADKADSQDICFVPSGRYSQVIEKLRPGAGAPGDIVHVDGRIIGRHTGVLNFTVGQRKGLGIAAGEPLYVVRIDAGRREVVVGPRSALEVQSLALREVNWLGDGVLSNAAACSGFDLYVRVRSSQALQAATLTLNEAGQPRVLLHVPEPGIAPGQACVFYDGLGNDARILGGGIIAKALTRTDATTKTPHSPVIRPAAPAVLPRPASITERE